MNQIASSSQRAEILPVQATYHCELIISACRQGQVASLSIRATFCVIGAPGGQLTHGCPEAVVMGSDDQPKALMIESEVILTGLE